MHVEVKTSAYHLKTPEVELQLFTSEFNFQLLVHLGDLGPRWFMIRIKGTPKLTLPFIRESYKIQPNGPPNHQLPVVDAKSKLAFFLGAGSFCVMIYQVLLELVRTVGSTSDGHVSFSESHGVQRKCRQKPYSSFKICICTNISLYYMYVYLYI